MTNANKHMELLLAQLSTVFKFVNDQRVHRTDFNRFKPLMDNNIKVIDYRHLESGNGRSQALIKVDTGNHVFFIYQLYNFGVLLNMDVVVEVNNVEHRLVDYIGSPSQDTADIKETLIDFEYAISVVTENIAKQLTAVGE